VTFILLLLSLGSVAGAAGIVWMLFGPTGPLFAPMRLSFAGAGGFTRAPSDFTFEEAAPNVDVAPRISAALAGAVPPPLPPPDFSDATHLDARTVVVELPEPIAAAPVVTPVVIVAAPAKLPSLPKVAAAVSLPSVPRLGVASSSKGSHLAPRPKSLPPLPTRSARGTATPLPSGKINPSAFATDQVTIANAEAMTDSEVDCTVVD
jgi:hypothetical protein